MKTARRIAIQMSVYTTGCCKDQSAGTGSRALVFPKSWRAAWVTADTGFQLAIARSGPGNPLVGTKGWATKLNGKMKMNEACCNTSGVGRRRPTQAMIHDRA